MIKECCICGREIETRIKIGFNDLMGSGEYSYYQHVGICRVCGYVFTQNPFTEEQLENRYKNMSKFEYDDDNCFLDDDYAGRCNRQKNFLEENIDFSKIESILEIGAASGYNLSLYKKDGLHAYGIEPSEANCRLAKKNYDVDMFNGMLDEYVAIQNDSNYDMIFLSMILEHIVNPKSFIEKCNRMCSKYMFIEVPTLDIRCDEEPFGIFCEEHVNLFTLDSLNVLMNSCGYRLRNVENVYGLGLYLPAGYPAMMTLWEKTIEQIKPFKYNLFSAEEMLDKYIVESKKMLDVVRSRIDSIPSDLRIAIWGIGHHASMLLANTSLGDKQIVRVYDSDKRKEQLKFAGISIEPFNMCDINSGYVEAILLTTYTAQKVILKYIKKLKVKCHIYTLYDLE